MAARARPRLTPSIPEGAASCLTCGSVAHVWQARGYELWRSPMGDRERDDLPPEALRLFVPAHAPVSGGGKGKVGFASGTRAANFSATASTLNRAVHIELLGLSDDEIRKMLASTRVASRLAEDVVSGIAERSSGNPIFILELLQHILDEAAMTPRKAEQKKQSLPQGIHETVPPLPYPPLLWYHHDGLLMAY
jgi:hypothetical protein